MTAQAPATPAATRRGRAAGTLLAELRKLWTVRTTWALTAIGLAVVALSTSTLVFSDIAQQPGAGRIDPAAAAIDQLAGSTIFVLVVGLLVMTTEFRHQTIGRTLQLVPSRGRVLLAKLSTGALYGTAFYLASVVLVGVVLLLGAVLGAVTPQGGAEFVRALWQAWVAMALTGLLGVAVGALLRSQVVAITASLVWLMIVENLAAALSPAIGRWLPFQALNAVFLSREAVLDEPGFVGPLPPALALTVFVAYVAVATIAAGVLMTRRDV